jgi:plastocyanin
LTVRAALGVAFALTGALALIWASAAQATNQRVAISNYQWSIPDLHIDMGEHVTWYWTGPDVVHSVTGDAPNDASIDSDPGNPLPDHPVGDSFAVDFPVPGVYPFRCKLHPSVRGTVTVSDKPGDPEGEPAQPVPKNNVDTKAPEIRQISLDPKTFRGRGEQLHFSISEPSKLDGEYYRIDRNGRRSFAGWDKWKAYVGLNEIRFGRRGKHFKAQPGRYVADLRATDYENNTSRPRTVHFRINAPR